jgi:hypothetical protein
MTLEPSRGFTSAAKLSITPSMRATRANIAGLGTAGSLVVGTSVVFVLASAAVGFGGWPKVANSGAAPAQVLSAGPVGGSPVARRPGRFEPRRSRFESRR